MLVLCICVNGEGVAMWGLASIQSHLHCHTVRQAERGPGANVTMWKGVMTGGEKKTQVLFLAGKCHMLPVEGPQ